MSAEKQVQMPSSVSASRCIWQVFECSEWASVQKMSVVRTPDVSHAGRVEPARGELACRLGREQSINFLLVNSNRSKNRCTRASLFCIRSHGGHRGVFESAAVAMS